MLHLVCLFMKIHLLALLQDNFLVLVHCAFLLKLSGCMWNITAFCQHLLSPIQSAILADTNISVKPKYRPDVSGLNPASFIHPFIHPGGSKKQPDSSIIVLVEES